MSKKKIKKKKKKDGKRDDMNKGQREENKGEMTMVVKKAICSWSVIACHFQLPRLVCYYSKVHLACFGTTRLEPSFNSSYNYYLLFSRIFISFGYFLLLFHLLFYFPLFFFISLVVPFPLSLSHFFCPFFTLFFVPSCFHDLPSFFLFYLIFFVFLFFILYWE